MAVINGDMPLTITAVGKSLNKIRRREENSTNRSAARERGVLNFASSKT